MCFSMMDSLRQTISLKASLKCFVVRKREVLGEQGTHKLPYLVAVSLLLTYTGPIGRELEAGRTLAAVAARAVDAVCVALTKVVPIAALVDV